MLYRAENISVFVEGCNFKIKCPKKLRPAGDYCHLKVSTLKVKGYLYLYMGLLGIPNMMHIEICRSALPNKNAAWCMRSGALKAGLMKTVKSRY